jgi:lipooligosaccharide transport system permease protein
VAGLLTGMSIAAPTFAMAMASDRDTILSMYFRFAILPMFLFSGAFFPVSQLPALIVPLAYATPLWHGVHLARMFALGDVSVGWIVANAGYLCVWTAAGAWLAARAFRRRLVT